MRYVTSTHGMPTRHLAVTESITNVCVVTLLCVVDVTVALGCQRGRWGERYGAGRSAAAGAAEV